MPKFTLGGDRLGSGAGMQVDTKTFNRSTHDLSYRLKTTASAGTLIPFMAKYILPGSSHKIKLNCDIMTGPTVGPLFGSFKVQLDMFTAPVRLYQAQLHNDKLGIGKTPEVIKFPVLRVAVPNPKPENGDDLDNFQIDPSHLLSYLDYRGMGNIVEDNATIVTRDVNGLPILALGDIYKNYYSNKQEGYGAFIHRTLIDNNVTIVSATLDNIINDDNEEVNIPLEVFETPYQNSGNFVIQPRTEAYFVIGNWTEDEIDFDRIKIALRKPLSGNVELWTLPELFDNIILEQTGAPAPNDKAIKATQPSQQFLQLSQSTLLVTMGYEFNKENNENLPPKVVTFPLTDIDDRREDILSKVKETGHYLINDPEAEINETPNWYTMPYQYMYDNDGEIKTTCTKSTQEGLFVKTYQNDLLQTYLAKEITSRIDNLTAVQVRSSDELGYHIVLNELNLNEKLYNFLNDINATSGSYRDYIKVAYNTEMARITMSPVYVGGLSKELVFQQIISNAQAGDQPLGTLAGRGVLTGKHKGGHVRLNVDEPSYVIGLFSLTPRIDYSQGNTPQMDMVKMTDLHNPYYDQIGFQDLPMEWMHYLGTAKQSIDVNSPTVKQVVGKQPAWTHWQTEINKVRGNFADKKNQSFMVLNRNYEIKWTVDRTDPLNVKNHATLKDNTTYIDPVKYNFIFASTDITAQNFWVQIDVDHEARMVMSAQPMPRI